jgi:PiT family inorganic phosphate transporter
VAKAGFDVLVSEGIRKIGLFIVLSPLIGLAVGLLLTVLIAWLFHRVKRLDTLNKGFRRGQLVSAAAFSLGHGANDAQKTMGIILALLIAGNHLPTDADVPLWVVLSAHTAIGLGTLTGGWRIVKTMGSKITRLQPAGGVAAESAAAATLFFTSAAGIPVSTTHTITGAIVGVGAARRLSAVRWGIAGRVVWAWVLTIPGAFVISFATFLVVDLFS